MAGPARGGAAAPGHIGAGQTGGHEKRALRPVFHNVAKRKDYFTSRAAAPVYSWRGRPIL